MDRAPRPSKLADFFDSYTKDFKAEDLQRLFTRDARDAYRFFTRGADADALKRLPCYSDGITEAENPSGTPFDEIGLETALKANCRGGLSAIGAAVERAVERHTDATRFTDDLTILLLRRCPAPMPTSV